MKVKDVKLGGKFKFVKIEFVKLDNAYGGCLCFATDALFKDRFDEDGKNNWVTSTLRQKLTQVIGEYIDKEALVPFDRDLTPEEGMTAYGHCTDTVSLLTCDEYHKYKKFIPNSKKWYWLITAEGVVLSHIISYVHIDGSRFNFYAYFGINGVRPICVLKPDTIVEVEE